jgi:hypothetical protein
VQLQFGGMLGGHGVVCRSCGNFEQVREAQAVQRTCGSCRDRGRRRYESVDPFYLSADCSDWRDLLL